MPHTKNGESQQHAIETVGTTVYLETKSPGRYLNGIVTNQVNIASGFFVERDKIATNFHVLHGATEISAKRIDTDTTYTIEGIIATSLTDDLVILKVAEKETPFNLGDSDTVRKGDRIYGLGYLGNKGEVVDGTIQRTRKRDHWFIVKVSFKDGWSGCPVLNANGKVVAVVSSGNDVDTSGYLVPSNNLKVLLTEKEHVKIQPLSAWQKRLDVLTATEYELYERSRWYKRVIIKTRVVWHGILGTFYGIHATIKRTSGDYTSAIAIYNKIISAKLTPFLGLAYSSRGMAMCGLENFKKAIDDVNQAILLEPEDDSVYFRRGHINLMYAKYKVDQGKLKKARSRFQDAINDLTEAINLNPEIAKYYNLRGWTKYLLGQVETQKGNRKESKKLFQAAISDGDEALHLEIKNDKFRSATYHTRGAAKAGLGNHQEAIEDFNECLRLKPKEALYYHDRGVSNDAFGQHEAAKADFAKAKELDPHLKTSKMRKSCH